MALQNLSHRCYTIVIKNKYVSDGGTTIDVDSLDNAEQADDSLTSSNVGHKLLQMMGWSGGGLGKEGGGISEPITAQAVFNRQGLGTSTSGSLRYYIFFIEELVFGHTHFNRPTGRAKV